MSVITYELRKSDLVEFNEHHAKMNGAYGKSITRHQIIWPAVVLIVALFIVMSSQDIQLGVYLLTGAFVWSIGVPAWIKKRFHQDVEDQLSEQVVANAVGEYTLKVTDVGLLEIKPTGEALIEWADILKFEESKRHAYIYLQEDSAITIPKEMISEETDYKTFYGELIQALKANASSEE